ncbi:MAG: nitrogenase [Candidatus Aureabacteria bacterium]|nr:nitrogenase [Candidatus Auribacterota bacterium]
MKTREKLDAATQNPCKLCAPLGASIVFRGIRGALPFLHGSQGCSTYIRRYLINHFREPVDIASSNFSEETTIFGGKQNLLDGLKNICRQYQPEIIGVASTCLSETIGDDVPMILREFFLKSTSEILPKIVSVSTPSYSGTHMDGFHNAVLSVVSAIAARGNKLRQIGIFPGLVSSADIRYLKEVMGDFGLDHVILPDYSETLDGGPWTEYQKIQQGGTSVGQIASLGHSSGIIEFGDSLKMKETAGTFLEKHFSVPRFASGLPIGIKLTDLFFKLLEKMSGREIPSKYRLARSRLVDSYVDGHKHLFEKKAVVYGDEDIVIAVASFLFEIGVVPVLCATGARTGTIKRVLPEIASAYDKKITVCEGIDFEQIYEKTENLDADFMIGNSKGYYIARKRGIPLIRIGFPIHDRIGAQRILHLGYRGTQQLFDRIVNTVIEKRQEASSVGYSYI